jgi:flagellar motor switch protein FliN/FliY
MSMSQEEIDQLISEGATASQQEPSPAGTTDEQAQLFYRMVSMFGDAVHNILPILVGESQIKVETDPALIAGLSETLAGAAGDPVYFTTRLPSLTSFAFVGWIDKVSALAISRRMMNMEEETELNEVMLSALNEAFGNFLGAWDSALKDDFKSTVEHSDFKLLEGDPLPSLQDQAGLSPTARVCVSQIRISIDDKTGAAGLLTGLDGLAELYPKHPMSRKETVVKTSARPFQESPVSDTGGLPGKVPITSKPPIQEVPLAKFEELTPQKPLTESKGIDLILDVPLSVTVELGRRRLTVREILELVPGSLVELDKLAGENVDLFVNGKLFAKGEVVVVDENFGVRIASIVAPKDRIEKLR